MRKNFVCLILVCFSLISWKWQDFSIKRKDSPMFRIETAWVVDTVKQGGLRPDLVNNSPPLIHEQLVVQGNAVDGVKAYNKKTGKLVWDFNIPSGVASPLVLHQGNIYFGGADGFFYSLQFKSGLLNWKYFNSAENSSAPLISNNSIYWLAGNQKVYALDLKGALLWIYSDSSLIGDFSVRGASRPAVYKNDLYVGFPSGSLIVLNRKTGQFKWRRVFSQPIIEDLNISKKCLFTPVFNSHLFCLNPLNGKTLWKLAGGSSVRQAGPSDIYQFSKGQLYAFKNKKLLWKKQLETVYPFSPVFIKNYLIYGSSSKGDIIVLQSENGKPVGKHHFGKGLAGAIAVQGSELYFLSVSAYLHKLSLKSLL